MNVLVVVVRDAPIAAGAFAAPAVAIHYVVGFAYELGNHGAELMSVPCTTRHVVEEQD